MNKIGMGNFGEVLKSFQINTGKFIAVKRVQIIPHKKKNIESL